MACKPLLALDEKERRTCFREDMTEKNRDNLEDLGQWEHEELAVGAFA